MLETESESTKIRRRWAMPNKYTFEIEPIKKLVLEEMGDQEWIDPFAGMNSPAAMTNDINPEMPTKEHRDALEFLRMWQPNSWAGGIFDPPYSPTQVSRSYRGLGLLIDASTFTALIGACKDEMARIIKPGGKVICCGWNTNGLGTGRGFEMLKILVVPHGGSHNDTLVTVERKVNDSLF